MKARIFLPPKKTEQTYNAVLFGATYLALGYALSHDNCLVVDKSTTLGSEFFGKIDLSGVMDTDNELVSMAKQMNVDNTLDMQKVLCKLVIEKDVKILLETTALGAYTKPDSDEIMLYSRTDGQFAINAKRVIDTTSLGSLNYLANDIIRKDKLGENGISKYICAKTDEEFIKKQVPFDYSYDEAAAWLAKTENNGGLINCDDETAEFYGRFIYEFADEYTLSGNNYLHIPSAQFSDCITAFERGQSL